MSGIPFDLNHALRSWREAYPDRMERIKQLRFELYDCRRGRWVDTRGGKKWAEYPETAANIERMLESEGGAL